MKNLFVDGLVPLRNVARFALKPISGAVNALKLHSCITIRTESSILGNRMLVDVFFELLKSLFEVPKEHGVFLNNDSILPDKSGKSCEKRYPENPFIPFVKKVKRLHRLLSFGGVVSSEFQLRRDCFITFFHIVNLRGEAWES